jgi:hypothetical protein
MGPFQEIHWVTDKIALSGGAAKSAMMDMQLEWAILAYSILLLSQILTGLSKPMDDDGQPDDGQHKSTAWFRQLLCA